jgi:multiple antibiotic resistance protein
MLSRLRRAISPGNVRLAIRLVCSANRLHTWVMPDFVFNAFVTLLVVVDPLGLAPIFAALTQGSTEKGKRETAIRGTLLGAGILLVFALAGDAFLGALGIGLPAFRIAGGILLFVLALDMVFARPSGMRARTVREQEEESYQQDVTVFPLAIP